MYDGPHAEMHVLGYYALGGAYVALAYQSHVHAGEVAVMWAATALHLVEIIRLCCGVHGQDELPLIFRHVPVMEVCEHLGHAVILVLAVHTDDVSVQTLCVTLPSVHAAVRAWSDGVARRRVPAQSPACLTVTTLLLCVRCATYLALDCVTFAVHVLEADPVYAGLFSPPTFACLRILCCVLAYAKLWWIGRAAAFLSALCG